MILPLICEGIPTVNEQVTCYSICMVGELFAHFMGTVGAVSIATELVLMVLVMVLALVEDIQDAQFYQAMRMRERTYGVHAPSGSPAVPFFT